MPTASVQWAYNALHHLGLASCHGGPQSPAVLSHSLSSTVSAATALSPNVLASTTAAAGPSTTRVLLLARRSSGSIAGVELADSRSPFQAALPTHGGRPLKQAQLAVYLARRGVPVVKADISADGFCAPRPLLLHSNHLIGWKLAERRGGPTASLYAHSLRELSRLGTRELKTLDPEHCLLGYRCFEWDNWRQLAHEPGWTLHYGDDTVLAAALSGDLSVSALPSHCAEIELTEG